MSRSHRYSEAVLRRLRWPVAQRLGVHAWGDERSRLSGPGVEYADVREYQWGEDARLIDWNLTARSDQPYVRQSHPDRGMDVWLIVDSSRSLDWGTSHSLKRRSPAMPYMICTCSGLPATARSSHSRQACASPE